jgi:amino acid transporter
MAESVASTPTLRRVLGFRTVLSTSAGLSYAAISFLGCVLVANAVAGDGAWLAILIAGVLALLAAGCFAELNALYPSAAAIRLYIKAAFNERAALIIAFMYTVTIVAVIAADSYVVGSAITSVFPGTPTLLWILAILGATMAANLAGIRIAGALQDVTTYALLVSAIAISAIGLATHGFQLHTPLAGLHDAGGLFNAVTAGVFVFSAFEWVTPLAEEISDHRLIPRGMFIAIGILFVSYGLFTLATTNLLSVRDAHGVWHLPQNVVTSAFPQMLMAHAALGATGTWWMLIATLFTGVMTFNGGFATASRFLYAAAREGTMPAFFARLNRFTVPWVTIVALSGTSAIIAVVIFATGAFQVLILVGAALEAMIYAVAGLCVIQLRRRQPQAARSFRIPGGWAIPVLTIAIFGVLFGGALVPPASQLPDGTSPIAVLAIFAGLLALTTAYVLLVVPRLQAKLATQRSATRRRRPPAATPIVASLAETHTPPEA